MDQGVTFRKLRPYLTMVLPACLFAVLLMSGLLFVQATSAAPSFQPKTDFATGLNPYSVTSADFNGDGKTDLATANLGSNDVSVLFGNGSGGFGAKTDYPSQSMNPTVAITSGDFNGDGAPDLATANPQISGVPSGDEVRVLLNDGGGGFGAPVVFFTIGQYPTALTGADLDGNGKSDLAMANNGTFSSVSVLTTADSGGANLDVAFDAGILPNSVVGVDFNRDNKPDLATANDDGSIHVLFNGVDGDPVAYFTNKATFQTGTSYSGSISSGDFNGDGKADLASANTFTDNVSVLLGDGDRGVLSGATRFTTGVRPLSITNADFDGDGKPDLVTANQAGNSVSVLQGNGSGGFGGKSDFATGLEPFSVVAADFNGDGKPDLATANRSSNNVSVLLGKGSSPGPGPGPGPGPEPAAKIGSVKVKGPAKVKKGKQATYTTKVTNSGKATATGVKLKVSGKGIKLTKKIGSVSARKTKAVKVKLKFKKPGKVKLTFKVSSSNAGSKTVKKKVTVKK